MECNDCNEVLFIDVAQTRKLYEEAGPNHCECANCKNYYNQLNQLSQACRELFDSMGIDLAKCRELWCYSPNDCNKMSHYSGCFPIVGRIFADDGQKGVTKNWVEYEFVPFTFRLRFERLNTGGLCLGFEADFPTLIYN